jgi:hypothetical protein
MRGYDLKELKMPTFEEYWEEWSDDDMQSVENRCRRAFEAGRENRCDACNKTECGAYSTESGNNCTRHKPTSLVLCCSDYKA